MKPVLRSLKPLGAAALLALAAAGPSWASGDSYGVTVAFDASFDTTGKLVVLQPQDEDEHPAAFWNSLKTRLASMKLSPVKTGDGQPASLRTGLYVSMEITKSNGEGQVRITNLVPKPLILVKDYYGLPRDVAATAGWSGEVEAECVVGTDGRCGDVKVNALPGIPQSVLRWAGATLALWRFQPPEINGKAIAVPVHQSFTLNIADDMPVDFRDKRKL